MMRPLLCVPTNRQPCVDRCSTRSFLEASSISLAVLYLEMQPLFQPFLSSIVRPSLVKRFDMTSIASKGVSMTSSSFGEHRSTIFSLEKSDTLERLH